MFYSEQLLAKTGPLARVWLASNVERKLSKSQILQSDIQSSIGAIVDQGQAPMALRLSGQLMLGVVRIYGRKARYLLDDCNEALLKIRMTFKNSNNHDLPANATTNLDLNLPELLTIDDLFPSMDFTYPSTQPEPDRNQDLDQDWTSTLNPQNNTQSRLTTDDQPLVNDEDLGLDFGDRDEPNETTVSVQYGRGEVPELEEPLLHDDDLNLDLGDDIPMQDDFDIPEVTEQPLQLDETLQLQELAEEEVAVQQPQRIRKAKPMIADKETVLHNRQIKAQGEDRSKILKPISFLPRDPVLLTLMNMQKNGDFVTNAMNDARSKNWAPELQGLLSFEVVHRSGQLKRKRDSGIGGITEDERVDKSPRLDLDEGIEVDFEPITTENLGDVIQGEDDEGIYAGDDTFDETTIPLIHPADNGPISLGTKRAVHLLREKFGEDGSPQSKKSVLLQDLVPEGQTTKEDATKMFFEILVLATKDAIKIDQQDKSIGLPLRIRGKRGLWGSWAEAIPAEEVEE